MVGRIRTPLRGRVGGSPSPPSSSSCSSYPRPHPPPGPSPQPGVSPYSSSPCKLGSRISSELRGLRCRPRRRSRGGRAWRPCLRCPWRKLPGVRPLPSLRPNPLAPILPPHHRPHPHPHAHPHPHPHPHPPHPPPPHPNPPQTRHPHFPPPHPPPPHSPPPPPIVSSSSPCPP